MLETKQENNTEVIRSGQVGRNRDDMTTGRIAAPVGSIWAYPRKSAFRKLADQFQLRTGITELVDNVVDNFHRCSQFGNHSPSELRIDIRISPERVEIFDNSGGVQPEELGNLVTLGAASETPNRIGVWSMGFKMATLGIGWTTEVTSTPYNGADYYIDVPDSKTKRGIPSVRIALNRTWWLDEKDWEVPIGLPSDPPSRGVTRIEITELREDLDPVTIDALVEEVTSDLGSYFGDIAAAQATPFRIFVNDIEVKFTERLSGAAIRGTFASGSEWGPGRHVFSFVKRGDDGRSRTLDMEVIAGIQPTATAENHGAFLFGDPGAGPRYFVRLDDLRRHGFTDRVTSQEFRRVRLLVTFKGDADLIPWTNPIKNGYREDHPLRRQVQDALRQVIAPLEDLCREHYEFDTLPFSSTWDDLSLVDRVSRIVRPLALSEDDANDPDLNQGLIDVIARNWMSDGDWQSPLWDHQVDKLPPTKRPFWDGDSANEAKLKRANRNKILRRNSGLNQYRLLLAWFNGDDLLPVEKELISGQMQPWSNLGQMEEERQGGDIAASTSQGARPREELAEPAPTQPTEMQQSVIQVCAPMPEKLVYEVEQLTSSVNRAEAVRVALAAFVLWHRERAGNSQTPVELPQDPLRTRRGRPRKSLDEFDQPSHTPGSPLAAQNDISPEEIGANLQLLTPREREVLKLRMGINDRRKRTLKEVGYELKITPERVRQIELRALRNLRARLTPEN